MDTTVADPLVGQVLDGRYRIESRIARGGMATVYLSRDLKLDRVIALKVMHTALAQDDDFVRRFIGEAKSAAALSHPNVVAVYDQGTDGQHVYLAMEYVPGRTLRDVLVEQRALSPRRALEVIQPVLAALGAAHRAGLVHRDVKPENVLITDDGQIKVADFGLARAETAGKQTKTGMIIGTVGYLAPEQVISGQADVRSDVYASGIMLFELLTGQQPHVGDTPLAVVYKHVNEAVPLPSSVVPGIPPQLDALVSAATSRDPAGRPADANHFLAAVSAAANGGPPPPGFRTGGSAPPPGNATSVLGVPPHTMPGLHGRPAPNHTSVLSPDAPLPDSRPLPPQSPMDRLIEIVTGRYVLVALGTIAAVVIGWAVWYQTSGQYDAIPRDIIGMQVTAAQAKLEDSGLQVTVIKGAYDDKVAKGMVSRVSPEPGTDVRPGDAVKLTPSLGPWPKPVPDVSGKSLDEAKSILEKAGFKTGPTDTGFSTRVPRDQVAGTIPAADRKLQPGKTVTIVISKGIQLPNVVGQNLDQARSTLQTLGLQVEVVERRVDGQPPNTVLAQNPPAGSAVQAEERITLEATPRNCILFGLICNDGGTLGGDGDGDKIDVPFVVGKPIDEANQILVNAGFRVRIENRFNSGRVIQQNPVGGKRKREDEITLLH